MFAGHLAVALTAKTVEPKAPLGALIAATFGIDLIWPVLLLVGAESVSIQPGATAFTPLSFDSYPWSHSLAMVVVWSALAWAVARALGVAPRAAVLIGIVVLSHWALDLVVHRPDLPLWPGGPEAGLGLWNSIAGTVLLEGALFVAAIVLFTRTFRPRDRLGSTGIVALLSVIAVIWIAGPFSPPPPNEMAIAVAGLGLWILPVWAWRIEQHLVMEQGPATHP